MNTQRKTTIIWVVLLFIVISCHGQNYTVFFGYDANGNRIGRSLTVAKMEQKYTPTDTIKASGPFVEAINDFESVNVSVYPNPTHEKLTVSLLGLSDKSVKACIVTATGTTLILRELSNGIHDFDLANLSPGVYLLQLFIADKTQTWKIIKN